MTDVDDYSRIDRLLLLAFVAKRSAVVVAVVVVEIVAAVAVEVNGFVVDLLALLFSHQYDILQSDVDGLE